MMKPKQQPKIRAKDRFETLDVTPINANNDRVQLNITSKKQHKNIAQSEIGSLNNAVLKCLQQLKQRDQPQTF